MIRTQTWLFFRFTSYALSAYVILVVGKAAWYGHARGTYSICTNSTTSQSTGPFASFATLHLPFAPVSPHIVHLGTDVLPVVSSASSVGSGIGKCTVMHGKYDPNSSPAFDTHLRHSEIHHYPVFVLDRPIVDGLWSKEAALLAVLLHEMSKPADDRLRWLMWFDADTLVVNPLIAVESFLPDYDLDGINLIVTEDWNGLNNGVFLIRVSAWSVSLLTDTLSYPFYKPDEKLPFTEQSAMERTILDEQHASGCIYVPPRWFNSYPRGEDEAWTRFHVERGDMMLHFTGVGDRRTMMRAFYEHVVSERDEWEIPLAETHLRQEIADFWKNVRMQREPQTA